MVDDVQDADAAPRDEAVELVHWLVMHPDGGKGAAATLGQKADVSGHTIGNWLNGKFPGRDSPAVRKVHQFAQSIAEYPPRGPGNSLPELIERRASVPDVVESEEPAPNDPELVEEPPDEPPETPETLETLEASSSRSPRPRWWWFSGAAAVVIATAVVLAVVLAHHSAKKTYPSPVLPNGDVVEYSDNHDAGTHVYRNPQGDNAPAGLGDIPYGYKVVVACKVPDQTGDQTVTALYLIASGKYEGLYAVSDTMTNGNKFGVSGGNDVDPRVKACQNGTITPTN